MLSQKTLRKALAIVAGAVALSGVANANIVVESENPAPPPHLALGENAFSISASYTDDATLNFMDTFIAGPLTGGALIDIDVINADADPAGFDNLVLKIISDAQEFVLQITADAMGGPGVLLNDAAVVALTPGGAFTVMITGDAYAPGASTAFFAINFSAVAVPLPAAAPFLVAGLAGLAFATRRNRKA